MSQLHFGVSLRWLCLSLDVSAKSMASASEKKHKIVAAMHLFGFLAWLAMPAAFAYYYHLLRISPQASDEFHSIRLCEHGHVFYVTPSQSAVFFGLLFGGALLSLALMLTGDHLQRNLSGYGGKNYHGPSEPTR
jgi:hypothetical protein